MIFMHVGLLSSASWCVLGVLWFRFPFNNNETWFADSVITKLAIIGGFFIISCAYSVCWCIAETFDVMGKSSGIGKLREWVGIANKTFPRASRMYSLVLHFGFTEYRCRFVIYLQLISAVKPRVVLCYIKKCNQTHVNGPIFDNGSWCWGFILA